MRRKKQEILKFVGSVFSLGNCRLSPLLNSQKGQEDNSAVVPSESPTDAPHCAQWEPIDVLQCSDGKQLPLQFSLGCVFTCLSEQITEHFLVRASLYVYTESTVSIHGQLCTHPQTEFYIVEGRMESMPIEDSVSLWNPRGWHGAWHSCGLDGWMNRRWKKQSVLEAGCKGLGSQGVI